MKLRSVNKKFLKNLKKKFGGHYFSTKQAEKLYLKDHALGCNDRWEYLGQTGKLPDHSCHPKVYPDGTVACPLHWRKRTNEEIRKKINPHRTDTVWQRMSARNTLCAAVQHGLLIRISRGIYYIPKV